MPPGTDADNADASNWKLGEGWLMEQIGRGELLRAWRQQHGLTQTRLAERLVTQRAPEIDPRLGKATISKWERETLRPHPRTLRHLDRLYEAGGALIGLDTAAGTPHGLPPRNVWTFNVPGPSGPSWAWIRPQHGPRHLQAELVWGPLKIQWKGVVDGRGLLVTSGTSVDNPPIVIRLDEPGWVDVGKGTVPDGLGFRQVAAEDRLENHRAAEFLFAAVHTLTRAIKRRSPGPLSAIARQMRARAPAIATAIRDPEAWNRDQDFVDRKPANPAAHQPFTGAQYRSLREARGLSLQAAASRASGLPLEPTDDTAHHQRHQPVTKEQIRRIELGHEPRHVRYARARLDSIYGAGGVTVLEPVERHHIRQRSTTTIVSFPPFWVGPVWLDIGSHLGPADSVAVQLTWGPWTKRLRVSPASRITCRRASVDADPLIIRHAPGVYIAAGMGEDSGAIDINPDWLPADKPSDSPLWDTYRHAHIHLFRHTRKLLQRL